MKAAVECVGPLAYLAVALGGALGACARFALARSLAPVGTEPWPWSILLVNAAGALGLGFLTGWLAREQAIGSEAWRTLLGTGFLAAFTTWSTFVMEAHSLLVAGQWLRAAGYLGTSLLLSVGLFALGHHFAQG